MRFHLAEAMIEPSMWLPLAQVVEEVGFDGMTIPDSLCYPEVSDSKYPYTPDGNREFLEDKPFFDPFTQIAAMGAVTKRIRFTTFVVKLPVRNPVIVAKQASSVAVLTDGRFDFGVGISPWPDDYAVTGVPWARRGRRMNECIDIMRGLWTGEFFGFEGELYQFEPVKICPKPSKPIPVMIGGHSEPALKRAARVGDGWLHAGGDPKELVAMIDRLKVLRAEYGREDVPFDVRVISMEAYTPSGLKRLEDAGVTDVIVGFRNAYQMGPDEQTLDQKRAALERYAEGVIARVG